MHPSVEAALPEIVALRRRVGVRRLDLFGSAIGPTFDPRSSDVDVLVEFSPYAINGHFDDWFTLKEGLESIFDRPVDLVSAANVRNPYFLAKVERHREQLYAA